MLQQQLITGINTSGINLNQELNQVEFGQNIVIGTGSTVTSIGAGTINISISYVKYYWR